jgi:SAM-dependent methyltransferase
MLLYALTVFVSAFLLFQVQPIIAKMILPWFGGSAMVWTSCMLFFQMTLLGGYAYSHAIVRRPVPWQTRLHLGFLVASLVTLPINPRDWLKPGGESNPLLSILLVLFVSVGLPYFMLSTTGPLMQAWYAASHPGRLPYRLFALSNFGSLLALLAYPVLIEPSIPLRMQGWIWSGLFALFAALCAGTALRTRASMQAREADLQEDAGPPPTLRLKLAWMSLAACASILLLAVTNHLTQNIAAIPFLWILPLALYLLSFMLCFDSDRWYNHWVFTALASLSLIAMGYQFWKEDDPKKLLVKLTIGLYCLGLFLICMYCHGEVARRKPHPKYLTGFYLMISVGGALGGFFVSVLAPLILPYYFELSIGLALTALCALFVTYRESWITDIAWAGVAIFLIVTVYRDVRAATRDNIYMTRNFYGALRLRESGPDFEGVKLRTLVNGTINHGAQFLSGPRAAMPTTYYGERSGVGVSILNQRKPGMRVGVIGLGAGTLAIYGQPGEYYRIYEINPSVRWIAGEYFTYTKQSKANVEIVMGDARLSLEREAPNQFDVLAVDAFSSDAIPVHLLTREAVALYLRHVKPDGVIAIHVSNRYLNLYPVVQKIADALDLALIEVQNAGVAGSEQFPSDWILLTRDKQLFQRPEYRAVAFQPAPEPNAPLFTDDYSNLYGILR